MPPGPVRRAWPCAAVLLALAARPAAAQPADQQPIVVAIAGPCVLSLNGRSAPCSGVAYMAFPENHRINFTAAAGQAGWAFSGLSDERDEGRYTLTVDSVLGPGGRMAAQGECDMEVDEDGRTVDSIDCQAATAGGALRLQASGDIVGGDEDEDDDGAMV